MIGPGKILYLTVPSDISGGLDNQSINAEGKQMVMQTQQPKTAPFIHSTKLDKQGSDFTG